MHRRFRTSSQVEPAHELLHEAERGGDGGGGDGAMISSTATVGELTDSIVMPREEDSAVGVALLRVLSALEAAAALDMMSRVAIETLAAVTVIIASVASVK